ncbi:MarR family winged helix-turn-helix transcriptional regulator [Promicromonospora iranensis]|uniref:DNA-binding MarR family transcriptional regulator n=1 Tax=Promicromonospora iranensis TaxID=1105144 RepID=A0ABU2CNQ3_9MICO|nr:MarR family winged helix-turn-helix transcriptional regulator [Promicromonospora iranensis]MDR7382972.1 DNA-binding MarR family transcriptional regulator [Promicromonospora iranensis]
MTSPSSRTPSGTEAPAVALLAALQSLSRAQREAAARIAHELDWPRSGVAVLHLLSRCGPASLTDVATHLRVDLSVASRQVSTMADAGYVVRTVDAEDRRVRTVELTGAGHALAAEAAEQYTNLIDRAFAAWSPEDLDEATRTLDRLVDTISADTAHQRSPQNQQECA